MGPNMNGCGVSEPDAPMLNTAEQHAIAHPYTLAIRGRGDSHDLEYRQDGTANAILTPNGGRGGIGVGAVAFDARQSDVIQYGDKSGPLDTDGRTIGIAYGISSDAVDRSGEGDGSAAERAGLGIVADAVPSIRARSNNSVSYGMQVRRLTPLECERLQGFPDNYTLIPYRGKLAADGPRYKALGNSMAVPVVRWIGERMAAVDAVRDASVGREG